MSTLRQGQGYIPLHGSFWSTVLGGRITDRNPFNICLDKLKMVADKCHVIHTLEEDRPSPRWSTGRFLEYIQKKCLCDDDDPIHPLRIYFESCIPTPSITNHSGLFPMFEDIFGIKGISGLSQWILDSGATSSCTSDLTVFKNMSYDPPFKRIRVANGKFAAVSGVGDVQLNIIS